MALTEANFNKVCQILSIVPSQLTYQLTMLGSTFTSQRQTDVESQITLWDAGAGTKTTKLHPTESNKGVETSPQAARSIIQKNIALLLEREDWCNTGGMTSRVVRG